MKRSALTLQLAAAALAAALTLACGGAQPEPPAAETPAPAAEPAPATATNEPLTAVATFQAVEGHPVGGSVVFTQEGGTVRVIADLSGVARAGLHGFHLHATGDCRAHDFTSAGGHFNPGNAPHGCPADEVRHAGDFGNVEIAADGTGAVDLATDLVTVADGPNSVVGKAVIVHEGEDDCVTQPTGDAGARLACAVVALGMAPAEMGEMEEMDEMPDDGGEGHEGHE
jgi:Cu-Zn family superoxide dismutase